MAPTPVSRAKTVESIRSFGDKIKNLKSRPTSIIIPKAFPPRPSGEPPRNKALLIGVQEVKGEIKLDGPHKDVDSMVELLVDKFEYKSEDIVILVDKPDHPRPTYKNIIKEMYNLVRGAVAGDRLLFYYAGHACQKECKDKTEEDGMDEFIYPCDWNPDLPTAAPLIQDNLLKKILVDKLPSGSYLTAIFDSCHSATLLDLPHYNCNRVYFPWVSKGNKRKTTARVNSSDLPQSHNKRVIFQATRMTGQIVKARKTSQAWIKDGADAWFPSELTRGHTMPPEKITSFLAPEARKKRRQYKTHILSTFDGADYGASEWPRNSIVESPTRLDEAEPTYCTGFNCRDHEHPGLDTGSPKAHVISLSACQDEQLSWEDQDGKSMTQTLVKILKEDPHPTLQDFMFKLGYQIHSRLVRIHDESKRYLTREERYHKRMAKKNMKPKSRDPGVQLETQNWQDPQLSSQHPLDMSSTLKL